MIEKETGPWKFDAFRMLMRDFEKKMRQKNCSTGSFSSIKSMSGKTECIQIELEEAI